MWHYVALSSFAQKWQKWQNSPKHAFFLFSWKSQKASVALCGTIFFCPKMAKVAKFTKTCIFPVFLEISKNSCGTMWHYVALSSITQEVAKKGKIHQNMLFSVFSWISQKTAVALCCTMWHYLLLPKNGKSVKIQQNMLFSCFLRNLQNCLKHVFFLFSWKSQEIVALFGIVLFYPKSDKLAEKIVFSCFFRNLKKRCGTTLHYPIRFCPELLKLAKKTVEDLCLVFFCGKLKKHLWHYVALACKNTLFLGKSQKKLHNHLILFFWETPKAAAALCRAFWFQLKKKHTNRKKMKLPWKHQNNSCGTMSKLSPERNKETHIFHRNW